jgi:16S rRNA (adenine1518-N6/adenine1519-N6)-dimethyltransferase
MSGKSAKNLLKKHSILPVKGLGQNFLADKEAIGKIVRATDIRADETVLEIGPGLGVLTVKLAKLAKKVVAVEKDQRITEVLKNLLAGQNIKNVEIIQGDILKFSPASCGLEDKSYKIAANLPFYLTAAVIRKFLETNRPPKGMILVVQKEMGQRICAEPPRMNLLAASVQFYAKAEIVSRISKKSFWPRPQVDSVIIKITPGRFPQQLRERFFMIVKAGFSQPRKQLANNLKKINSDRKTIENWLVKNGIKPNSRAETLGINDWLNLCKSFGMAGKTCYNKNKGS